jgi:hypothetical protein
LCRQEVAQISAAVESEPVRICTTCLAVLPLSDFRLRQRGGEKRQRECNACHADRECQRRRRLRRKQKDWELARLNTDIANARCQARVVVVLAQMAQRLGGTDQLVDESDEARRRAEEERKRSYLRMSKEELEAKADAHVLKILRANPAVVIEAARSIGWTVKPPPDKSTNGTISHASV